MIGCEQRRYAQEQRAAFLEKVKRVFEAW